MLCDSLSSKIHMPKPTSCRYLLSTSQRPTDLKSSNIPLLWMKQCFAAVKKHFWHRVQDIFFQSHRILVNNRIVLILLVFLFVFLLSSNDVCLRFHFLEGRQHTVKHLFIQIILIIIQYWLIAILNHYIDFMLKLQQYNKSILSFINITIKLFESASYLVTEMRSLPLPLMIILGVLVIIPVNAQKTQCQSYVQQLINDILDLKIYSIPLQSLQYSGITKNNPGQMYQCRKSNFSYFLVFIKNTTANQQSFSGLCMPRQCKADDIEIALDFLHVNVYEERQLRNEDDRVALVGAVVTGAWAVLVVGWSLVLYWNKPILNQYLVGEKFERPDRGDGDSSNSNDHPSVQTIRQSRDQSLNLFNYRQGYRKLFKISNSRTNILSLILFLSVLSHSTSTQYSYRQKIAQNTNQILAILNSFWGIFICNNEIALQSIIFILGFRLSYALVDSKNKKLRIIGRRLFDHIFKKWLILILMSLLVYSFTYYCISQPLFILWNNSNCIDCKNYIWQIWFLFRNLQLDSKICLPWFSVLEAQLLLTIISAPLLIVYKTSKKTGYMFILLLIGASVVISSQILQTQHITFIPGKLMNSQNSYWIDYQGNTFVRMGAFYVGIFFGMFVNESLERGRLEGWERVVAGKIRQIGVVEWLVTIIGLLIMAICYSLITMYLDIKHSNKPYSYMLAIPLCFVFGLGLFILPSYIQGESRITKLIKRSLGWTGWTHLDRISLTYYLLAPMIIGYSTYSTQNSIHYGIWTIFTSLLGDLFLTYLVSVLVTALFENQILPIVSWLQIKVLGKEVQYSDIIIVEE